MARPRRSVYITYMELASGLARIERTSAMSHKPYALRRATKRHNSVLRMGRFSYCQECGRRMTATASVIRRGDPDFVACVACVTATGAVIKSLADGPLARGDFYQ